MMTIKVACVHDSSAYLPELHAYSEYFQKSSSVRFEVVSHSYGEVFSPERYDLIYRFMGFYPFWSYIGVPEIHEYHSLSVPPFAQPKDTIKRYLNRKPVGRVFLNGQVESVLGFSDQVPSVQRDMGVHQRFFDAVATGSAKEFDIVYCGTVAGRQGLLEVLKECLEADLSVLIVGRIDDSDWLDRLGSLKRALTVTGAVPYDDVPGWISKARFGLNFIPDVYPFNVQTSTKVLEYCAAGLGVVTNDYEWIRNFETCHHASFYKMESGLADLKTMDPRGFSASVDSLEWSSLLERCGLEEFLVACASVSERRNP